MFGSGLERENEEGERGGVWGEGRGIWFCLRWWFFATVRGGGFDVRGNLPLRPCDRWRGERGEEGTVWGMGVIINGWFAVATCKRNSNQAVLQIIKVGELVMLRWSSVIPVLQITLG